MNEELNKAMEQISDKHIAEAAAFRKKRHRPYWVAAVAAVLVVAIAVGVFFKKTHDKKVQHSQPSSYFYFDSFAEIYGLIDAYELSDDQFYDYVRSMKFRPYCDTPTLREGVKDLEAFIERIPLPYCDAEELAIYYYLYADALEIFCDTQGHRYRFLINTSFKEYSGDPVFTTSLCGYPLDMYLVDERLCGNLKIDGVGVWVSVFTNNPEDVDFSGFFLNLLQRPEPADPTIDSIEHLIASPVYPEAAVYPGENASIADYQAWLDSQYVAPDAYMDQTDNFFWNILSGYGHNEPCVISPVSIYLSLAALAECTDGDTRSHLLFAMRVESMEVLRLQAKYILDTHYRDDGYTALKMSNSLWLDSSYDYNQACVDNLVDAYLTFVIRGDLGSEEINQDLRNWVIQQTGDLLDGPSLMPDTVFALASTIEYRVSWSSPFSSSQNTEGVFQGAYNNTFVTYMHQSFPAEIYQGQNFTGTHFTGTYIDLADQGKMWLFLPDEDMDIASFLGSGAVSSFLFSNTADVSCRTVQLNLTIPKFDISCHSDFARRVMYDGAQGLDNSSIANFDNITAADIHLSYISHSARIAIDEDGIFSDGCALTYPSSDPNADTPSEEVDFVLDRPFVFVITSRDGLPLFSGVVEQP